MWTAEDEQAWEWWQYTAPEHDCDCRDFCDHEPRIIPNEDTTGFSIVAGEAYVGLYDPA